jgi:hypothetical protein
VWSETNCAVDVWIEVLHALGHDPIPGLGFTLDADFDGSQWSFLKYPTEDLRQLYAVDVAELNVWRPVLDHAVEQLAAGRLLTVEVDAWHLPDTTGTSYHSSHAKTTIVPTWIDSAGRRMRYLHGSGHHELGGEDFAAIADLSVELPPYVELVRAGAPDGNGPTVDEVRASVGDHLRRRPSDLPAERLGAHVLDRLDWLAGPGAGQFHAFAFATLRQFGAGAELAADLVRWLDGHDGGLLPVADRLLEVATTARTVQLQLARVAHGRRADPAPGLRALSDGWQEALDVLAGRYA